MPILLLILQIMIDSEMSLMRYTGAMQDQWDEPALISLSKV